MALNQVLVQEVCFLRCVELSRDPVERGRKGEGQGAQGRVNSNNDRCKQVNNSAGCV